MVGSTSSDLDNDQSLVIDHHAPVSVLQCSKLESWSGQRQQLVPPISPESANQRFEQTTQERVSDISARSEDRMINLLIYLEKTPANENNFSLVHYLKSILKSNDVKVYISKNESRFL